MRRLSVSHQQSGRAFYLVAIEVVRTETGDGLNIRGVQGEHFLVQDIGLILIVKQVMNASHPQYKSRLVAE